MMLFLASAQKNLFLFPFFTPLLHYSHLTRILSKNDLTVSKAPVLDQHFAETCSELRLWCFSPQAGRWLSSGVFERGGGRWWRIFSVMSQEDPLPWSASATLSCVPPGKKDLTAAFGVFNSCGLDVYHSLVKEFRNSNGKQNKNK